MCKTRSRSLVTDVSGGRKRCGGCWCGSGCSLAGASGRPSSDRISGYGKVPVAPMLITRRYPYDSGTVRRLGRGDGGDGGGWDGVRGEPGGAMTDRCGMQRVDRVELVAIRE